MSSLTPQALLRRDIARRSYTGVAERVLGRPLADRELQSIEALVADGVSWETIERAQDICCSLLFGKRQIDDFEHFVAYVRKVRNY